MHVRWESPSRYYEAVLQRDLLGDWVLSTANGGLRNRLRVGRDSCKKPQKQA